MLSKVNHHIKLKDLTCINYICFNSFFEGRLAEPVFVAAAVGRLPPSVAATEQIVVAAVLAAVAVAAAWHVTSAVA